MRCSCVDQLTGSRHKGPTFVTLCRARTPSGPSSPGPGQHRWQEHRPWVEREIVEPSRARTLPGGRELRLFFDKSSITGGDGWFERINLSILGSRCFLCVWSDDYLERDCCLWELKYAFPRAARKDFLFMPIANLSGGAQPGKEYAQYLQARQYIDAVARPDFINELKTILARHFAPGSP